jgi:hypothetical protein
VISRAVRGLDHHHIVLVAGVPLQVIAAHADLVAHEFVAELERIQPVGRNGAVAQADHRAAKNLLEFVLQGLDRVERIGVFDSLTDVENGGREFAGLLRRNPGQVGVDRGKDTSRRCSGP